MGLIKDIRDIEYKISKEDIIEAWKKYVPENPFRFSDLEIDQDIDPFKEISWTGHISQSRYTMKLKYIKDNLKNVCDFYQRNVFDYWGHSDYEIIIDVPGTSFKRYLGKDKGPYFFNLHQHIDKIIDKTTVLQIKNMQDIYINFKLSPEQEIYKINLIIK